MNPIAEEMARVNQHVMAMEKLAKDFLVGEGYMPVDIRMTKGPHPCAPVTRPLHPVSILHKACRLL